MDTILTARDLTIGYAPPRRPPVVVAKGLDVTLYAGELVCLLGPNGAGKTTLLRTLAALQPPLDGRVHIDGIDLHAMPARDRARRLSVVLTDRVHVGQLTAYTLVGLGRYPHTNWSGRLAEADHRIIRRALATTGASELADRPVNDLSDGERQKVLIARALAQEPRLMVLDEITAFLDLPRRVEVMHMLGRLARETASGVLLATHDLDLALRTADRIWLLPRGGPLQVGAPEDLILSGAFEAVFSSEGVVFDRADGSFRLHRTYHGEVALTGIGEAAFWTRRALERAGFRVDADGGHAPLRVDVRSGTGPRWCVTGAGESFTCDSVYELIARLRGEFAPAPESQDERLQHERAE